MVVKENPISDQYHQMYFTLSISTINKLFDEVNEQCGFSLKEQQKKSKLITQLVMDKIEEDIIEVEIDKIDKISIGSRRYRYLTDLCRDNPLLIICQFCVISTNMQLKFPPLIPLELLRIPFSDEVVRDFIEKLLVKNDEYEMVEVEKATKECIVRYDINYVQEDFKLSEIKNLTIDLNSDEAESILFINCKKNDIIILDESDNVKVIANVSAIHKKVVKNITDELVEKISFLNTKTVDELQQKIIDIFSFSTYSIGTINYLVEFAEKSSEIEFDEYVIGHFLDNQLAPKSKKERESYVNEVKKELVREIILTLINLSYMEEEPRFLSLILEEYEFDNILFDTPSRIDSYQEYINTRVYETRVLEYCVDNNIINYKK